MADQRSDDDTPTLGFVGASKSPKHSLYPRSPLKSPNVALLRALWSVLDGIWGVLKGSWGVLVWFRVYS